MLSSTPEAHVPVGCEGRDEAEGVPARRLFAERGYAAVGLEEAAAERERRVPTHLAGGRLILLGPSPRQRGCVTAFGQLCREIGRASCRERERKRSDRGTSARNARAP